MRKIAKTTFAALLGTILLGGLNLVAFADDLESNHTVTKNFVTEDVNYNGEDLFEESIEVNGTAYVLQNVDVSILEENPKFILEYYDSPVFVDEPEKREPEKFIESDGTTLVLVDTELLTENIDSHSEYAEVALDVVIEGADRLAKSERIEIADKATGQRVTARLELSSYELMEDYWSDDFIFPITISHYDAEEYDFNGYIIPNGADLNEYKDVFLDYLGLSPEYYKIESIEWDGDPYLDEDVLKRDLLASGSKLMRVYEAVYSGEAQFPGGEGQYYHSGYRPLTEEELAAGEVIEDSNGKIYVKEAVGVYGLLNVNGEFEDEELDDRSFIERIIDWILEHPVEASCLFLLLFVILFLFVMKNRRKDEGERDKDDVIQL